MNARFEVLEQISQNKFAVLYRALDRETGQQVALRRFSPNGSVGGGLSQSEKVAYASALEIFKSVRHPALRSVICGGCDEVESLPFIATEWVEGETLEGLIPEGSVTPKMARQILEKSLEISELLSKELGYEAMWVDTDFSSIFLDTREEVLKVTFWISPLLCLKKNQVFGNIGSLIPFTEQLLGWDRRRTQRLSGNDLFGWLSWLRVESRTTTIALVREHLATVHDLDGSTPTGTEADAPVVPALVANPELLPARTVIRPTGVLPRNYGQPVKKTNDNRFALTVIATAFLVTAMIVAGVFFVRKQDENLKITGSLFPAKVESGEKAEDSKAESVEPVTEPPPTMVTDPTPEPAAAEVSAKPLDLKSATEKAVAEGNAELLELRKEIAARGGVLTPTDYELLAKCGGENLAFEGILESASYSDSERLMHLEFPKTVEGERVFGKLRMGKKNINGASKIEALVRKNVRIQGRVKVTDSPKKKKVEIILEDRNAIEEVR